MGILGYVLIFLASCGGGNYAAGLLEKRKKQLASLRKGLIFLEREIDYQVTPLGEAFIETGNRIEKPWKNFFLGVGEKLSETGREREGFHETWNLWIKEVKKFHQWGKDVVILENLGRGLGQLDKKMQLAQLKMTQEELLEAEKEAEEERKIKGRLYQTLGPCFGLLGIILLL